MLELEARDGDGGERLELETRIENADRVISQANRVTDAGGCIEVGGLYRGRTEEQGLGWFDAEVVKFTFEDTLRFKVPHTGWNTISIEKESPIMKDIPENSEFYFVHSYYMKANDPSDVLNYTEYGNRFVSAISKDNIFGFQYHPEKSHDVGLQLIRNFVLLS